jgi:hypothetical protein
VNAGESKNTLIVPLQAVNGRCTRCSYRMAWIVIGGKPALTYNIRKASHT